MLHACIFIAANIQRASGKRLNLGKARVSNVVTTVQRSVPCWKMIHPEMVSDSEFVPPFAQQCAKRCVVIK